MSAVVRDLGLELGWYRWRAAVIDDVIGYYVSVDNYSRTLRPFMWEIYWRMDRVTVCADSLDAWVATFTEEAEYYAENLGDPEKYLFEYSLLRMAAQQTHELNARLIDQRYRSSGDGRGTRREKGCRSCGDGGVPEGDRGEH